MGSIYRGVVTHIRHYPVRHQFAYEVFMFMVDVDVSPVFATPPKPPEEIARGDRALLYYPTYRRRSRQTLYLQHVDQLFGSRGWWPLAAVNRLALATFREADHMKLTRRPGQSLAAAVRDEIFRATGARPLGRIQLLTNLAYLGYCFNPISIYYVWAADGSCVESILAEVSNTPWNEMHYYVLHSAVKGVTRVGAPPSVSPEPTLATSSGAPPLRSVCIENEQQLQHMRELGAVNPLDVDSLAAKFLAAPPSAPSSSNSGEGSGSTQSQQQQRDHQRRHQRLRFQWAKDFHVSPFMSMDHMYDWVFSQPSDTLLVQSQNIIRPRAADPVPSDAATAAAAQQPPPPGTAATAPPPGTRMLNTQLRMVRQDLSWWRLLYLLLVAFPLFTYRVQWLIHAEALALWWKGVPLFMHPHGSSNRFTRFVEALMTPIMLLASLFAAVAERLRGRGAKGGAAAKTS